MSTNLDKDNNYIDFWNKFREYNIWIISEILKEKKNEVIETITNWAKELKIGYDINFMLTKDESNCKKLDERKDYFQLILSPNWNPDNIPIIENLYKTKGKIPSKWSIIKYIPFRKSNIYELYIDCKDVGEFNIDNIKYSIDTYFNNEKLMFDIFFFIDTKFLKYVCEKKDTKFIETKISKNKEKKHRQINVNYFIPNEHLNIFLYTIIGEYFLINNIGRMLIYSSDEKSDIKKKNVDYLSDDLKSIYRIYTKNHTCNRCNYEEYHCKLFRCSKCKQIWYCSKTCQKIDWKFHKIKCKKV